MSHASNTTPPTRFVETGPETYAYRRFGGGAVPPLVLLQHFTGALDNWDPASPAMARCFSSTRSFVRQAALFLDLETLQSQTFASQ